MRKNKSFLLASFMTVLLVVADIMDKGLYITFNGIQYLIFDGENLPLPDSYEVNLEDKEADSGGETEAGTIQRDVVRAGVVTIAVTFSLST